MITSLIIHCATSDKLIMYCTVPAHSGADRHIPDGMKVNIISWQLRSYAQLRYSCLWSDVKRNVRSVGRLLTNSIRRSSRNRSRHPPGNNVTPFIFCYPIFFFRFVSARSLLPCFFVFFSILFLFVFSSPFYRVTRRRITTRITDTDIAPLWCALRYDDSADSDRLIEWELCTGLFFNDSPAPTTSKR